MGGKGADESKPSPVREPGGRDTCVARYGSTLKLDGDLGVARDAPMPENKGITLESDGDLCVAGEAPMPENEETILESDEGFCVARNALMPEPLSYTAVVNRFCVARISGYVGKYSVSMLIDTGSSVTIINDRLIEDELVMPADIRVTSATGNGIKIKGKAQVVLNIDGMK